MPICGDGGAVNGGLANRRGLMGEAVYVGVGEDLQKARSRSSQITVSSQNARGRGDQDTDIGRLEFEDGNSTSAPQDRGTFSMRAARSAHLGGTDLSTEAVRLRS